MLFCLTVCTSCIFFIHDLWAGPTLCLMLHASFLYFFLCFVFPHAVTELQKYKK